MAAVSAVDAGVGDVSTLDIFALDCRGVDEA